MSGRPATLLRAGGPGVTRTDPHRAGRRLRWFVTRWSPNRVGTSVPVQCIMRHLDVLTYGVKFLLNAPRPSRLTQHVAILTHPVAADPERKAKLSDPLFPFFEPFPATVSLAESKKQDSMFSTALPYSAKLFTSLMLN